MKNFRGMLLLVAVLVFAGLGVNHWQAPGTRLSAAEIDQTLERIEGALQMPEADAKSLIANMRSWAESDDGKPVHMLNLMRFRDVLQPWPGTTPHGDTPEAVNNHYEKVATGIALPSGLSLAFSGAPQSVGQKSTALIDDDKMTEGWDRVLVVRYPNRRAFFQLIGNPDYLKVMPDKFAAVELSLVPMSAVEVTPDVRFVYWVLAMLIFLAVGWWRASRRGGGEP